MKFTIDQMSYAVQYWGQHGDGAVHGVTISKQASLLVDHWAAMLYDKQADVELDEASDCAQLVIKALGQM